MGAATTWCYPHKKTKQSYLISCQCVDRGWWRQDCATNRFTGWNGVKVSDLQIHFYHHRSSFFIVAHSAGFRFHFVHKLSVIGFTHFISIRGSEQEARRSRSRSTKPGTLGSGGAGAGAALFADSR